MKLRLSIFATPVTVVVLSLLAGCGGEGDPDHAAGTGGSGAGGTSTASGGSGALGTAGVSTAGVSGGTGGVSTSPASTGGISGGGTGGVNSAGSGGAGPTGGTSGSGSTVPATFETFKLVIMQAPCFGAGCHNDMQNPLSLQVDDQLYTRLTSHVSKNCGNIPVVNPGKPQESALVKILKGPCSPTPRMPFGCVDDGDSKCIPADYIAAIEQWIANGAPQQ